jgi:O-antigen/teichoic acid export membrane protein
MVPMNGQTGENLLLKAFSFLLRWSGLLCVPGGVLWALSPLGVYLSEQRFHTPNVFWKLFPSAPLLLMVGLVGLHLLISEGSGWLERVGFYVALLGFLLILAGDVGEFWLRIDDVYIMTAPAYSAFRLGLLVLAVGSIVFGIALGRERTLPVWGALPFALGALCGLISASRDLESFGATLWILFGLGWAWLGFSLLVEGVVRFSRGGRARPSARSSTLGPKPLQSYAVTHDSDTEGRREAGIDASRGEPSTGRTAHPPPAAGDAPSGVPGVASVESLGVHRDDDTYVAKVARGAGISTAGQGVGRVLGYVAQVVLARLLGATLYGFYTAGVAVVNGFHILSRFGMENGVVRYVAHYREEGDAARVRGTIIQALLITLAISLVLSVVMFFGAGLIAERLPKDAPYMAIVLRAFAFVLPFFVFMSMTAWATQGFQTVTYAAYIQQLIRPALFLVLVGACYVIGAQLIGVIAAYGVAMFLAGLAGLYYLKKLFPPLFDRRTPAKFETRALFGVSVPMSIAQGAQYLNNWSAILILGAFAAGAPVGIFNAAARTATFLTVVRFAFSGIFSPIISGLYARQDTAEMGRLYKDVSRWIFTGAFALFLVIVVFAPEVMAVFGEDFAAGATALVIVAVAQLYSSSVGPAPRMLAMTENQNLAMIATAVAAGTGVVVSLILIPRLEVLGAAMGMATAIITENTGTMTAVKWRLGFWPFNLAWSKPLIAGLLAAAATYLLKLVLPIPGGPIPTVFVLGGFLGLAYLVLLLLFGLSETDKEFLGAFRDVALRYLRRGRRSAGEDRG